MLNKDGGGDAMTRKSDRMLAIELVLETGVVNVTGVHRSKARRAEQKKKNSGIVKQIYLVWEFILSRAKQTKGARSKRIGRSNERPLKRP